MKICLQNANSAINGSNLYLIGLSILNNPVGDGLYANGQFLKREVFGSQLYYFCERINNF